MKISILVKFIVINSLLGNKYSVQAKELCNSDENCKSNEFCHITEHKCQSCLECSAYNRQISEVTCPKSVQDCGDCLPGYEALFDHSDEKCEKAIKKLRALRQTYEPDSESSEDEDDGEEDVSPGIYVACIIAGLFVGFAVGGVGAILAYKLYFKKKLQQTSRAMDREKAGEKLIEMHEMQPGAKKYSMSEDDTLRTYELIVNNTKHFPKVKEFNSGQQQQEMIPSQANAAPVVHQNLYYEANNK